MIKKGYFTLNVLVCLFLSTNTWAQTEQALENQNIIKSEAEKKAAEKVEVVKTETTTTSTTTSTVQTPAQPLPPPPPEVSQNETPKKNKTKRAYKNQNIEIKSIEGNIYIIDESKSLNSNFNKKTIDELEAESAAQQQQVTVPAPVPTPIGNEVNIIEKTIEVKTSEEIIPTEEVKAEGVNPLNVENPLLVAALIERRQSDFYLKGTYGISAYTSVQDVWSFTTFRFAAGYNINRDWSVEFQYSISQFGIDDFGFYYNNSFYDSDEFLQQDFAGMMNYKISRSRDFDFSIRSGLSYVNRQAYNAYWDATDYSDSFYGIIGANVEFRINNTMSLTADLDFNFSINSGYDYFCEDILWLVNGESYILTGVGLKINL